LSRERVWRREWFRVDEYGNFGEYLGETYAPFEFDDNWGLGEVAFGVEDEIGFRSYARVNITESGIYRFEYGCDDGARLYIYHDRGGLIYSRTDSWKLQNYTIYECEVYLEKGVYTFRLDWYKWGMLARISFKVPKGIEYIKPVSIEE